MPTTRLSPWLAQGEATIASYHRASTQVLFSFRRLDAGEMSRPAHDLSDHLSGLSATMRRAGEMLEHRLASERTSYTNWSQRREPFHTSTTSYPSYSPAVALISPPGSHETVVHFTLVSGLLEQST